MQIVDSMNFLRTAAIVAGANTFLRLVFAANFLKFQKVLSMNVTFCQNNKVLRKEFLPKKIHK